MTAINEVTDLRIEGDVAIVTLNSPPVNALSANVRTGLLEGVTAAEANADARSIVLICEGRTFIAGADITESQSRPPAAGFPKSISDSCPAPVVRSAFRGSWVSKLRSR